MALLILCVMYLGIPDQRSVDVLELKMNILFEFGHFLLYKNSRTKRRAHLHNIALHLVNVAACLPRSVFCVRQWAHSKSRAETVVT